MGYTLQEAAPRRLSHVSMSVADLEATEAWWTMHFGYRVFMRRDLEGPAFEAVTGVAGARSRMLRGEVAPGSILQLFSHNWREPEVPNVLLSFEVSDAATAHEALTAAGVACLGPPVEFDNSWAFTTADPNGLPIEIIQWKPGADPYGAVVDTATLRARRVEVQARLRTLDTSFDDVVESIQDVGNDDEHDPDGSTIAFERAQLIALRRAARNELRELDAALARLAAGTFGTCTVCGNAISHERLEALPSTTTCVACAP